MVAKPDKDRIPHLKRLVSSLDKEGVTSMAAGGDGTQLLAHMFSEMMSRMDRSMEQEKIERAELAKSIQNLASAISTLSHRLEEHKISGQSSATQNGVPAKDYNMISMPVLAHPDDKALAPIIYEPAGRDSALRLFGSMAWPGAASFKNVMPRYSRYIVKTEAGEITRWLPTVETAAKIYRVNNVDTGSMTFSIDFVLHLDWRDPNLEFYDGELADLDWETQFFNPQVRIENAKDGMDFVKGADAIPRWYPSKDDSDRWLRKTARYKGNLFMKDADLKCFPFDVQMLPILIGALPCRQLPKVLENEDGSKVPKDANKFAIESSSKMRTDKDYLKAEVKGSGNFLTKTAGKMLIEFEIHGVSGHTPLDGEKGYQVSVFVQRPIWGSYTFSLVKNTILTGLALTSFWADLVLSGRMEITLMVILTVAVETRPDCISKVPYVTFFDRCLQLGLSTSLLISFANIYTVTKCAGYNEEAIEFMQIIYKQNKESCDLAWCQSTTLDCSFFLGIIIIWASSIVVVCLEVYRRRARAAESIIQRTNQNRRTHVSTMVSMANRHDTMANRHESCDFPTVMSV